MSRSGQKEERMKKKRWALMPAHREPLGKQKHQLGVQGLCDKNSVGDWRGGSVPRATLCSPEDLG